MSRESSLGSVAMEEEEDDLYGNGDESTADARSNGLEEGEEEEDDDESDEESDIEIVTERPDQAPEPTTASKAPNQKIADAIAQITSSTAANASQPNRTAQVTVRIAPDTAASSSSSQAVTKPILLPGAQYPAIRSNHTLDLNNIPLWNGKPVTEIEIDADLAEQMKPWRRPGADQAEYFNYGFDEFTWSMYCEKQKNMRGAIDEQKNESKMFEQMMGGMGMPAMPGMPGMGGGVGGGNAGNDSPMPPTGPAVGAGMPAMPQSEEQMMQQMMAAMQAQGISDPSQLDFNAFMQMSMGQQGGGGVPTGPSGGQQGWGNQQGGGGYGQGGGGRRGRGRW